ncbi:MAG: hypothetical protein QNJ57_08210 [Flavobacteriaceae bacterium]|nr:hypothetical protein [Flavobacteriaceae bacterium]
MKRNLPLLLIAFVLIFSSFSDEKKSKITWFKSASGEGYISMERIDNENAQSILKTTVNSYFGNEKLDFTTVTVTDSKKLANASKIVFNGTIDSNMEPVEYLGERLKTKKSGTFWSFHGNFKNEITNDPEVNQFLAPNHSAVIKMPVATIPSFNVWAIVSELPFNKTEGTFRFNSLDETKLYVKKGQVISYVGEEVADIDGEKQTLHKFVHQGKRMKPAYYWVNNDRELVKFILDEEFEFVVSTKEEALGRSMATITDD